MAEEGIWDLPSELSVRLSCLKPGWKTGMIIDAVFLLEKAITQDFLSFLPPSVG
jgi:hypothetical protein